MYYSYIFVKNKIKLEYGTSVNTVFHEVKDKMPIVKTLYRNLRTSLHIFQEKVTVSKKQLLLLLCIINIKIKKECASIIITMLARWCRNRLVLWKKLRNFAEKRLYPCWNHRLSYNSNYDIVIKKLINNQLRLFINFSKLFRKNSIL